MEVRERRGRAAAVVRKMGDLMQPSPLEMAARSPRRRASERTPLVLRREITQSQRTRQSNHAKEKKRCCCNFETYLGAVAVVAVVPLRSIALPSAPAPLGPATLPTGCLLPSVE